MVTDWNAIALSIATAGNRPGPAIMLDITMTQIAVHDAVQAYQRRFETYNPVVANATGSPVVAAASAARTVLADRFQAQSATIETIYQDYLTTRGLFDNDPGAWVGRQAALNILVRRANDGSYPADPEVFTGGTGIGEWRPTPPKQAPMAAPWFAGVLPFSQPDVQLLADPPPPPLDSPAYARDYNEVKAYGARTGSQRSAAQTEVAYFYSGDFFAQMNRVARDIAGAHLTDIGDSARLLALANISATDALIHAWVHKRSRFFWRPSTAIAFGDADGNPATSGDPAWLPLIDNPPYPDYTSGANSITAAFMRTLERTFGNGAFTFAVTTTVPQSANKTRLYTRFSDVAADVVDARVYLGIHFRFADVVARRQATQAADWAYTHVLRKR